MNLTDDLSPGDAAEGAMWGLIALMAGISEEYWCSGWIIGNEYALWNAEPGRKYGQGVISKRQAVLLKLLAKEAGGWARWDDNDGIVFVPMPEWRAHLDRLEARA